MFLFSNFKDVFFFGFSGVIGWPVAGRFAFFLGFMSKKKLIACYDSQHGGKKYDPSPDAFV